MIHPLFAPIAEATPYACNHFATELGFDNQLQLIEYTDSQPTDVDANGFRVSYVSDPAVWLKHWQPECPEGFQLAGKWDHEDGPIAFFVKPTTQMATALWLIGLGQMAQGEPRESFYSYRHPDSHDDEPLFIGTFATADEAVDAARECNPTASEIEVTARFKTPLASEYIDADDILETMREGADPLTPDHDWPRLHVHQEDLTTLDSTLKLLADGWATFTGNEPDFHVEA